MRVNIIIYHFFSYLRFPTRISDIISPVDGPLGSLPAFNTDKKLLGSRNKPLTQFHAPHFLVAHCILTQVEN